MSMSTDMIIVPRRSNERGHADHGWLKIFHTFSFASYQRSGHESFGSLRVINENRVAPRTSFGSHSHSEFDVLTYIVSGELEHKDSLGNVKVLKRGDILLTSAGTGISHREQAYSDKQVHFLQIWSLPSLAQLIPSYFIRHFNDAGKKDKWVRIIAPTGTPDVSSNCEGVGPAPVQSSLTVYSTFLTPASSLPHTFGFDSTKGYIQVVQTSGYNTGAAKGATIKVSGGDGVEAELREGDGAYIMVKSGKDFGIQNIGVGAAEVLLFELE